MARETGSIRSTGPVQRAAGMPPFFCCYVLAGLFNAFESPGARRFPEPPFGFGGPWPQPWSDTMITNPERAASFTPLVAGILAVATLATICGGAYAVPVFDPDVRASEANGQAKAGVSEAVFALNQ